ncbi:MAG: DUF814 domain-containing protein [Rhodothermaceae bacterium]|nr:DUF814 domain-containing protein [Rhodothermaceae bacterium]
MTYFTLHALAAEWDASLRGAVLSDAWTQSVGELSLALATDENAWTVRVRCDPTQPLLFRTEGHGRARRNTASVFESAHGQAITSVRTAERDRFVFFDFADGRALQVQLFGPRPNVFLVDAGGTVAAAFLRDADWAGEPAPVPRPAPEVDTLEAFTARWRPERKTLSQAVAAAIPLFDRALADEAIRRAERDPTEPPHVDAAVQHRLFEAARALTVDLAEPRPIVYWRGEIAEAFALVPRTDPPEGWRAEPFETVDAALRVFARRQLGQQRFQRAYRPLEAALEAAHRKRARSAEAMLAQLGQPSRADRYEAWGHLLMAQATKAGPGRETITLNNILGDGAPVTIPLDPAQSAIENAERYYAKARQTREARRHAEARWEAVHAEAETAAALLARLRAVDRYDALQTFLADEKQALASFLRPEATGEGALPYRRFAVQGWEVRVGKNAKGNQVLTTRHAGPHDLWLHARGVAGSHVVVHRPSRTATVPKPVVETAARIAAHFSKAKSQALVPVIVTERKYVRPIKGGPPGLVRVDREDVMLVEPGLPSA